MTPAPDDLDAVSYAEGSNNGTHLVEGDVRSIRYVHSAAVDAFRWHSQLAARSVPAPTQERTEP